MLAWLPFQGMIMGILRMAMPILGIEYGIVNPSHK